SVNTLFPLYREVGQLKAAFSPPLAKPEASANCKAGVDLTIPVDEGVIYKWDKAEWAGITALTAAELDALLSMEKGKPANGLKIDKAAKDIQKAYGRKGYLMVGIRSAPTFDDNAQNVSYRMEIREGPQFRMGRFLTKGFPETTDKALHERWALKTGDIFDQGYSIEFSQKQMNELMRAMFLERRAQNKPAPNLKWDNTINRAALTVDVILELTN
ncbi:MAG TPA: POTRA domain-containing protein, partial [Pyrinomonadaceae bacterium]|nr:POTRA domain-containing protein [Pyrinomonadaceae bacterium]